MGEAKEEIQYCGEWLDVRCEQGHEYITRKRCSGIVIIVAVTEAGELLLTEQHRIPVGKRVLELPAGLVGDEDGKEHETEEEAAKKELLEETGYEAGNLRKVAAGPITSGISSESLSFYYTDTVRRVNGGGGNDHEAITVHRVPLSKLEAYTQECAAQGMLIDPKIFIGAYFANKKTLN